MVKSSTSEENGVINLKPKKHKKTKKKLDKPLLRVYNVDRKKQGGSKNEVHSNHQRKRIPHKQS